MKDLWFRDLVEQRSWTLGKIVFFSKETGVTWGARSRVLVCKAGQRGSLCFFPILERLRNRRCADQKLEGKGKRSFAQAKLSMFLQVWRSRGTLEVPICHLFPLWWERRHHCFVLNFFVPCTGAPTPRMALCALWARLQTHLSQHPSAFVTYPVCLLPPEFCLGNVLPTLSSICPRICFRLQIPF